MIELGKTYVYKVKRAGGKNGKPIELKVVVCGMNIEKVGVTKDMVLVKTFGQPDMPTFYVKKSNLYQLEEMNKRIACWHCDEHTTDRSEDACTCECHQLKCKQCKKNGFTCQTHIHDCKHGEINCEICYPVDNYEDMSRCST